MKLHLKIHGGATGGLHGSGSGCPTVGSAPATVDDADDNAMLSAEAPVGEEEQEVPPPDPAEETGGAEARGSAANGEVTAAEPDEPERGDGDAARLKRLNGILVRQTSEGRKQIAALEQQLGELSADAAALADAERDVLLAAVSGPLKAAEEERAALMARLAEARDSLECAQAEAAGEASARGEAVAQLQAAVAENEVLVERLRATEAEAEAAAERVAGLEAAVAESEAKSSELRAEKSELERQLEDMTASARATQSQKEVLESSFDEFKKEDEVYKQEMEAKLHEKLIELEALQSRKAELEAKVASLEAELSEAVARKHELESQVDEMETETAAAKEEVEKLQAKVQEMDQKHSAVVAEVARLQSEIDQVVKGNEAGAAAHDSEKKLMVAELEKLKGNMDMIQAEKDEALGMVRAKDVEAEKLRDELKKLHDSMAEIRAHCDELDGNYSCLKHEKNLVLKELEQEKSEAEKLKFKIQELESYNRDNDSKIGVLKAEVGDKEFQIKDLNDELQQLQLAVAEAQRRGKNAVWTWLGPATTTVLAAASFVYAARSW